MIRDGRDVVSSRHGVLGFIAKPDLWRRAVVEAKKNQALDNFTSIKYENLVHQPEVELSALQAFLGLKFPFDLNDWIDKSSIKLKKSILTGRDMPFKLEEITRNSIGNWQRSESPHITEFLNSPELMRLNRELGYT